MKPNRVISLELNELNFELLQHYVSTGALPHFKALIDRHSVIKTHAEREYRNLEPWIQWPTVYTGKSFAEHKIFRLGDCVESNAMQIWETLESMGVRVAAISPMNARNACKDPTIFLPDPWTQTKVAAPRHIQAMHKAITEIVNSNATNRSKAGAMLTLLATGAGQVRPSSIPTYLDLLIRLRKFKWSRALILDRLLADAALRIPQTTSPFYLSLFLNSVAHIQHHHMFESDAYEGDAENPEWYSNANKFNVDPLFCAYRVYDNIVGDFMRISDSRILITTGLSQRPNPKPYFQYRPVDHAGLMRKLGVPFDAIAPRMSRDFSLMYNDAASRALAVTTLERFRMSSGEPLFRIEVRDSSLFCQIAYRGEADLFRTVISNKGAIDIRDDITLVSIENGIHQTIGFHIDTGIKTSEAPSETIPLGSIFEKTIGIFA